MVAVLPFAAFGDSEDIAFFASDVHDELLTQLAQLQEIRVISRTSVMGYRDGERNIRDIGFALEADPLEMPYSEPARMARSSVGMSPIFGST